MRTRAFAFLAIFAIPQLGVACAAASVIDESDDDALDPRDGGDSGVTTRSDTGPATPPKGSSSGTSDGGSSGTSDGGGSSGASSGGGPIVPGACEAAPCSGADDLGIIAGDGGEATTSASAQGKDSAWVTVFVKDTIAGGSSISWSMKFTPVAGIDYEVRVADDLDATCSTATTLIPPAQYQTHSNQWTDAVPGVSDGHYVYIEVKQLGATCPSATAWKLQIDGGT